MLYGYAGLVDAMVRRIKKELGSTAKVVATGGQAQKILSETETIDEFRPHLTLEGLRLLYERSLKTIGSKKGSVDKGRKT